MKNNEFLRKTSLLALAIGVLAAMMVAPASAVTQVDLAHWEFDTADQDTNSKQANYPSATAYWSAVAQKFQATSSGYIANLTVKMCTTALLDGSLTAVVGGVNEATGLPDGSIYDVSTPILASSIGTISKNVTFAFDTYTNIVSGSNYTWWVMLTGSTSAGAAQWDYTSSDTTAGGGYTFGSGAKYAESQWTLLGMDFVFQLTAVDEEGGGTTPTATVTSWDTLITNFTSFVVPIFVILLPALLLMVITKRSDKWIILIGITIGVGLGYFLMPTYVPLWLVFLVAIGLVGMAYQSVRGGSS